MTEKWGFDVSFITKKFIKEINNFLSNNTDKLELEPESKEDKEYSVLRNDVRHVLNKLPNFYNLYSKNRAFDGSQYITYNSRAKGFKNFRLKNFSGSLNDSVELKWFGQYANNISSGLFTRELLSIVKKIRKDGHMLLKCTTTTFSNAKYMVGNYCDSKATQKEFCPNTNDYSEQHAAIFDKKDADLKFDSYFDSKIIPIRGFVRYDERGKEGSVNELEKILKKYNDDYNNPAVLFSTMILSTFIKGERMAEEAEYRFVMFSPQPFENFIDINSKPKYKDFTFPKDVLLKKKNKFYCDKDYPRDE